MLPWLGKKKKDVTVAVRSMGCDEISKQEDSG